MKQKKSIIVERRLKLKRLFSEQQVLQVTDISKMFGVSQLTVRRDFDVLAEEGFIERTHGGGKLLADFPGNSSQTQYFNDKHMIRHRQKQEIAAYVSSLVEDGDTVFLNAGSTTLEIMRSIRDKSVVIVTNNAMANTILRDCKASLISTGGEYNPHNQSYTGLMAVSLLQRINATICILGVNGITGNEGITTSNYSETMINEEMLKRCKGPRIIAADGSKIGRIFKFSSAPITSTDILVTDNSADSHELKKIQNMGVKIVLADKKIL